MWWDLLHLGALIGAFLREAFDLALVAAGIVLVLASYGSALSLLGGPAGALLGGPIGKVLRWAGVALILVGGCRFYVARQIAAHDARRDAADATAVAQAQAEFYRRGATAAAAQAAETAARVRSTERVKRVILHDGANPACRNTPAFAAAAAELRRRAAADAGQNAAAR